jgi:P-type Cu2+ transporter
MTCCVPTAETVELSQQGGIETDDEALLTLSRKLGDGTRQLEFAVPDAHCASCIRSIETGLEVLPQVKSARVNLSKRRVRVVFDPELGQPKALAPAIHASGYHTYVLDPSVDEDGDPGLRELVKALAVAGFAAGNIMLFSVSVWSGANEATRDLFHWISAIIALPAIAYAGQPFFRSAWRAVRVGRTNMDVPITIGVILATALSLYETINSGRHAYFDASATLLFFLLAGRTLDYLMRERARSAITNLARIAPRGATRVHDDGRREYIALKEIEPGMVLELRAGERVPVDSEVTTESASFDTSIVNGESASRTVLPGEEVMAGANTIGGIVQVIALKRSEDSLLARMVALMEAAEGAKTKRRRIADRAAAVYAPIVHTIAILTFLGWGVATGDWHNALLNAVAVLIITCPCALALAVPIVHVVAAGKLFEGGVLMKDGAALERAAEADSVAFDKTGTLTIGRPRLFDYRVEGSGAEAIAVALARASTHPLSQALVRALHPGDVALTNLREQPGHGVEAIIDGAVWRLGSRAWCGLEEGEGDTTAVWLSCDKVVRATFRFEDEVRADAREAVRQIVALGLPVRLLSGDAPQPVASVAAKVGISVARARLLPEDKVANVEHGHTMMVGDGINDAPALRAAHVSMAPSTAADIGRSAADFVFTGGQLGAVPLVIGTARRAASIVNQNLVLAIGYNAVAVPLAISGHVTPLVAAIAMSSSSIIVVANALRLRIGRSSWPTRTQTLQEAHA